MCRWRENEPAATAHHLESFFRRERSETIERYHTESSERMARKWAQTDFSEFIPEVL